MPRVSDGGDAGALRVAGIYRRLLERERKKTNNGNPRRVFSDPARPEEGFTMYPIGLFRQLEAGEPVRLPWWQLGGHTVPDERIRRLKRDDRSITGWIVHPDDTVIPERDQGRRWT
jgi:hypothetical protein